MRCISVLAMGAMACLLSATAQAASSPQVLASGANTVPACVTTDALMQTVRAKNARLDARFKDIAATYETAGRKSGVRWDYAFFQMLIETGHLTFERNQARSDMSADTNNFVGIRTPSGDKPDRFPDMATGVAAHLHHLRVYAGDPVSSPAARRTKEIESFIVPWARKLGRPVTFADLAQKWASGDKSYGEQIEELARGFAKVHCNGKNLVASAEASEPAQATEQADERKGRSRERGSKAQRQSERQAERRASSGTEDTKPSTTSPSAQTAAAATTPPTGALAGDASAANAFNETPDPANANCRVWSASFGGEKSVLIKVEDGKVTHFTALQVESGKESEQTTAYIAAYARGGRSVGEFANPDQAINKAFELCPKT